MFYFNILIVLATLCVHPNSAQSCNPPTGGKGQCKGIYECEPLLVLVNKRDRTPQETELLKRSQCGFQGNTPTVCCPVCFTPDGQQGNCTNVYSCPHLLNMLQPPVSNENMQYVQNSKCDGPEQYSVCCGPPPTTQVPVGNCKNRVSAFPPDRRSGCCGVDSIVGDRIIGGIATRVDEYPWLAIIEYVKLGQIKLLCGGVLISGRYVITAGHCVSGPVLDAGTPKNVRLGEYNTTNPGPDCARVSGGGIDCTTGVLIVPIEKTIPHPDYNSAHPLKRNDIALIRLQEMAPWTDFIRPICLPTVDLSLTPPSDFTMYAAGWGAVSTTQPRSSVKLHVDLPFVNQETCQSSYRDPGRNVALWNKQVCAGGQPNKDSCKGDSGGPLMYENARIFEVIGIVSFGPRPCGLEGVPGVYTKVYEYNNWIRANIEP